MKIIPIGTSNPQGQPGQEPLSAPPPSPKALSDSHSAFSRSEDVGSNSPYARTVSAQSRVEFSPTEPTGREAADMLAQIRTGRHNSRMKSMG